jgi:predicted AAA+ superfamily ATPase
MRPMTLSESGHSDGAISLARLLAGEPVRAPDPGLTVADLAVRVCVGGWPGLLDLPVPEALMMVRGYLEETARADLVRVDGVRRDPVRVLRVLRALARNTATYATLTTIAADATEAGETVIDDTVGEYLRVLERLMIVEDQPAWAPSLRSRSRLRSAAKRHFVDPSLAVAALSASPEQLLRDVNLLGCLFESLVVRDLRVYAEVHGGRLLQYHDNTGAEADAIIETAEGGWAAFEIKLGPGRVDAAAASLLRMVERIDLKRAGKPRALGVIVGFGYGYVRDDGVAVIPIGALSP